MKRQSLRLGLGLALLAAVLTAPGSSPSQTPHKVTLLTGGGLASDEPARRMYYTSISGDEGKILALRRDLIAAGARNVNAYLPGLIVCEVPVSVDARAVATDPDITVASEEEIDHKDAGAPVFSREWAKRWYLRSDELAASREEETPQDPSYATTEEPAPAAEWGVRRVPEEVVLRDARRVEAMGAAADDERLIFQNSEIMAGDILIQLILPESQSGPETWTDGEIADVAGGIVAATMYYQQHCRRTKVNFVTRRIARAATTTEPIQFGSERDSVWVSDVMSNQGYDDHPHKYLETVHAFNNHWRVAYNTDWVITIFAVRAVNDPDHMFENERQVSFSYLGGPFLAVPYPAGRPGAFWFGQAVTLEMAHIFWAGEEAIGPGQGCEEGSGYLNYWNSNKTLRIDPVYGTLKSCVGTHEPCVADKDDMLENGYTGAPCRYTEGMMGYADNNPQDGVPDAFGVPPEVDFGTAAVETLTAQRASVRFEVRAVAVPNRNSQQEPAGLRRAYAAPIMNVNYTIAGVGPISLLPEDGAFDELEEDFDADIAFLMPGYSDLVVAARNVYGARAEVSKQIFYVGLDYYGFRFVYRSTGVGLGWSMRGERFGADFDLHRLAHNAGDADTVIATNIQPVGSTTDGGLTPYYYFDTGVTPGAEYSYYVRGSFDMYYRGKWMTFTTDSDTFRTVAAFPREGGILSTPSPNPFRPTVDGQMRISVSVPDAAGILNPQAVSGRPQLAVGDGPTPVGVTIKVYDVLGRLVKDLYDDRVFVTVVTRTWDGTNQRGAPVPSGMYFIKAKAGSSTGTKKVLVIR